MHLIHKQKESANRDNKGSQLINKQNSKSKKNKILKQLNCKNVFFIGALVPVITIIVCLNINTFDSDGYFLLATGRNILTNGIPTDNPFFVFDGYKTVIQQWPWAVALYWMYSKFGYIGLTLFSLLPLLGIYLLFYLIGKEKHCGFHHSAIASAIFTIIIFPFINVRPTLITLMLLLFEIYILEKYQNNRKPMTLLWLLPLSVFMVNIHAANWPLLFIFLLPYLVPALFTHIFPLMKTKYSKKPFLYIVPLMILCGFVNPYGLNGMMYLYNSYNNNLSQLGIVELESASLFSYFGLLNIGLLLCGFWFVYKTLIYKSKKGECVKFKTNIDFSYIDTPMAYLFFGTFLMSCMHIKNTALYGTAFALIYITTHANQRFHFPKVKNKQYKIAACLVWLILPVFLQILLPTSDPIASQGETIATPVQAVNVLDKISASSSSSKIQPNIYTDFNTGAYLEWRGYENLYLDARPELMFKTINQKEDVINEYIDLQNNRETYKQVKEKYKFDYWIVENDSTLDKILEEDESMMKIDESTIHTMYAPQVHLLGE